MGMEKVIMDTARTEQGYSCACSLLPGWVVAYTGDFDGFRNYVKECIDFYIEGAKEDGESYPAVFDSEYEIVYKFDVQSLLDYYRGYSLFPHFRQSQESTKSNLPTMLQVCQNHVRRKRKDCKWVA